MVEGVAVTPKRSGSAPPPPNVFSMSLQDMKIPLKGDEDMMAARDTVFNDNIRGATPVAQDAVGQANGLDESKIRVR